MKIGCSSITGVVFIGNTRINKKGVETWSKKEDVTDEAMSSVAQSLLVNNRAFCFDYRGESYKLQVEQIIKLCDLKCRNRKLNACSTCNKQNPANQGSWYQAEAERGGLMISAVEKFDCYEERNN